MKTNASRRLASYLSAGVCVAVTEARADIIVTFYDNPAAYPSGISMGYFGGGFLLDTDQSTSSFFAYRPTSGSPRCQVPPDFYLCSANGGYFQTRSVIAAGVSEYVNDNYKQGQYGGFGGNLVYGASAVDDSYANISFDGNDLVYEAVGKFDLTTAGSGKLLAIAVDTTGDALTFSAGVAAIDAAAVPEPSGFLLGLLALGAAGRRRRRNAVSPRQVSL